MNETKTFEEKLIEFGGKEWQTTGRHRIYFNVNVTAKIIGLECNYYNSGNISSATLNGSKISNSEARRILYELEDGKLYFDYEDQKFHWKSALQSDRAKEIVSALRSL